MNREAPGHKDRIVPAPAAVARLRAQVIEQSRHVPSPTHMEWVAHRRVATSAVLLVSLSIFAAVGGIHSGPRPTELLVETALGSTVVTVVAAIVGVRRGRSALGPPRSHLLAVALLTPLLLLALRIGMSASYPGMMVAWPERPGLRCLVLSAVLAQPPLIGLLWMRRDSDPVHPRSTAAALGTAAGAFSWMLVDLWCPVSHVPHLLIGHLLPLLLTIAASVLLGNQIVMLRPLKPTRPPSLGRSRTPA
jgi:hypothetical protein